MRDFRKWQKIYGNKVADSFEINPITVIFCNCSEMKIYRMFNKHRSLQQRYKMMHR